MSVRRATAWVIECDAPDCLSIVVPEIHKTTQRESERGSRVLTLCHSIDGFAAARAAGWAQGPLPDFRNYCPAHTHLASDTP
jgi:hypothetical protein